MIESVLMFLLGGFLMAIGTNAAVNWFVTPLPKVLGARSPCCRRYSYMDSIYRLLALKLPGAAQLSSKVMATCLLRGRLCGRCQSLIPPATTSGSATYSERSFASRRPVVCPTRVVPSILRWPREQLLELGNDLGVPLIGDGTPGHLRVA
jgi:hypothetical protein